MRRWIAITLSITLLITSFVPALHNVSATQVSSGGLGNIPIDLSQKSEEQPFNYEFVPVSTDWIQMTRGVAPALFSGVHYELAKGVVEINSNISDKVSSAAQLISGSDNERRKNSQIVKEGGYIPKDILEEATLGNRVAPGTVFVDVSTATAFKVVSPVEYSETTQYFKDTYSLKQPQINEIVSDFTLTEETIELTLGNINGFAENVEKHVVMNDKLQYTLNSGYKDFKYLKDPLISLQFPEDTELVGYSGNGSSLSVIVNGGIGIGDMNLTGKYSGFSGYRIGLNMKQESYLSVELATDIDEEIRIPLLGLEVPFGIGQISGGVFLLVDMNGELRLEIQVREFTENTIGIKGKTAFYVPCTYRPIFENNDSKFEGDVDIAGQLNGELKAGALLEIEIFGLKLVGAGAFVGAGLNVAKNNKDLYIELYAMLQAYLCFMGKNFNLVNYHLTILEKKQRDTGGYRIEMKEALLSPQRVGGIIRAQEGVNYIPAEGIEYRIKIIPQNINPDSDSNLIRYYPAQINGQPEYDTTNDEGEFFREDVSILYTDRVCIEFKAKGSSYESEAVKPTLPFKNIRVLLADYFNEYVTGQVEPVRLIRWNATKDSPPEEQTELVYYQGYVTISMDTGGNQAIAITDKNGYFNTSERLIFGDNLSATNNINIYPDSTVFASIDAGGLTLTRRSGAEPSVDFEVLRVIDEVDNSYHRYQEGNKVIDQAAYNEYLWVINKNGSKTLANNQFSYEAYGYSSQDKWTKGYYNGYYYVTKADSAKGLTPNSSGAVLTAELDEDGNQSGSAVFAQTIKTEWVWQPPSNPITITSDPNAQVKTEGGTFQITASGNPTLVYSLINAPTGVTVDSATGRMEIPAGLSVGSYPFKVHVEQKESTTAMQLYLDLFPVYKEDTPPPAEQSFTLIISDEWVATPTPVITATQIPASDADQQDVIGKGTQETTFTPSPTKKPVIVITPALQPTPTIAPSTPTPGQLPTTVPSISILRPTPTRVPIIVARPTSLPLIKIAPVFADQENDYEFTKLVNGGALTIPMTVSGTQPISFSLEQSGRYELPREVTIDTTTGTVTVNDRIIAGTYYFTVLAKNSAGTSRQTCKLTVTSIRIDKPRVGAKDSPDNEKGFTYLASTNLKPFASLKEKVIKNLPSKYTSKKLPVLTIRNDHATDLYTRKQNTINGAEYVLWEDIVKISIEGTTTVYYLNDDTPLEDHHLRPLTKDMKDELEQQYQKLISDFNREDILNGEMLGLEGMKGSGMDISPTGEQSRDDMFVLDYGSVLTDMGSKKAGSFEVSLDDLMGTFVTGKFFTGLKNNAKATLSFLQPGAVISFQGNDINSVDDNKTYNFAYSNQAPDEAEMIANLNSEEKAFTYSFAHHGELPGMATFAITTEIAEGTKVNVYKFDASAGTYILIAGGLKVGPEGVVTYQNNTMSEYLITTQDIENASIDEVASMQENLDNNKKNRVIFLIAVGAVMVSLLVYLFILKKRRIRDEKKGS